MLGQLVKDYPEVHFKAGKSFIWSPNKQTVYYDPAEVSNAEGQIALLHELGHALLGHTNYQLDVELLDMEVSAWTKAKKLASYYNLQINEGHIEDCLDTYRLWLHKRSRCPECDTACLQESATRYRCFLCGTRWRVAPTRTLQPRRMAI